MLAKLLRLKLRATRLFFFKKKTEKSHSTETIQRGGHPLVFPLSLRA